MKKTFLILSLVFGCPAAWADSQVTSDVVVQLDNSLFASPEFALTSLLSGHEVMNVPDMTVAAQVPVQLSGISVEAAWQLETPGAQLAIGIDIPLVSKSLDVRLMIRKLAVDAWIDQQVGGITVHVHVLGDCENIPLLLTGAAKLSGVVRTGVDSSGLPTVGLAKVEAEWADGAWAVGDFTCRLGGESFRAKVLDGFKSSLAAPTASLNDQLRAVFSSRLAEYQDRLRSWFLEPRSMASGVDGVSLTLRPRAIAGVLKDGFALAGQIDFKFASSVQAPALTVNAGGGAGPSLSASGYQLAFPEGLPAALSAMAYRLGLFQLRQPGGEIQAFQDFLGNPFFKIFIWPQMLLYSQYDPFYFDFSLGSKPRWGSIVNSSSGGVTGQIATDLRALLWAPTHTGEFVKMVRFSAPLTTTYRWTMEAAKGGGSDLQIALSGAQVGVRADWEADYFSRLVNPSIAVDVLKDHFASWVEGRSLKFHLPPLKLSSSTELSLTGLRRDGEWLTLQLKP